MQEAIAKSVNATRRSRVAAPFRAFFGRALDVALPTLCPACREPVGGNGLCAPCWSKLSLIAPPYCERLGIPFAYDPGPGVLSMQAIADPPAYHRARAAVRYDDIARDARACAEIRRPARPRAHHGTLDGARRARTAGGCRCADPGAAALAAAVGAALQPVGAARQGDCAGEPALPVADAALKRVKATAQQVGLVAGRARTECARRLPRAAGGKAEVAGRRLVLIDDVLTSGATSDACARALLRAGARSVDVLVFARVVDAVRATI